MEEDQKNTYILALRHFGEKNQIIKAMEECGELIQALAKSSMKVKGLIETRSVLEELADVQIMIHQMALIFGKEVFDQLVIQKTNNLAFKLGIEMSAIEKHPESKELKNQDFGEFPY